MTNATRGTPLRRVLAATDSQLESIVFSCDGVADEIVRSAPCATRVVREEVR